MVWKWTDEVGMDDDEWLGFDDQLRIDQRLQLENDKLEMSGGGE